MCPPGLAGPAGRWGDGGDTAQGGHLGRGRGELQKAAARQARGGPGQLALQVCFLWFPWPRFLPRCGAAETTQAESRRSLCREGRWDRLSMGASAARRWHPARVRGDKSGEVGRTRVQFL